MPVRRVKRTMPSGRQFSIFGGAMYGMRRMRARRLKPLPRGLMLQGAGRRRRRVGRGFLDTLKNIGSRALNIARSVPIASTALGLMGKPGAAGVARSLGFGRRRRVGARRKRRTGRGLLSSLLGMTGLGRVRRRRRGGAVRRRRYVR